MYMRVYTGVVEKSDLENSFQAGLVSKSPLFQSTGRRPVARCSYLDRNFSREVPNQENFSQGGCLIKKKQEGAEICS